MSEFSEYQNKMLVEQGLTDMARNGDDRFLGVPAEGVMPDGTVYVWSGMRWFKKKESMR